MVYRIFVEKKEGLAYESYSLKRDVNRLLGIKGVTDVRILNRYDAENLPKETFDFACKTIFAEPQIDNLYEEVPEGADRVFAVEYLPGQFDQRANSAEECIQLAFKGDRPSIRSAKVYLLSGDITDEELAEIKKYVINPVEAREASMELPETLAMKMDLPETVETMDGFIAKDREELAQMVKDLGLAMDLDDIAFCQEYFKSEDRDPTVGRQRPDHHRDPYDRHLLVRPLPSYDVPHHHRQGHLRGRVPAGCL